jgi:hypothetical protein
MVHMGMPHQQQDTTATQTAYTVHLVQQLMQRVSMLEQMVSMQNQTSEAMLRLMHMQPAVPAYQQQQQQHESTATAAAAAAAATTPGNDDDGDDGIHVILLGSSGSGSIGGPEEFRNCRRAAAS